MGDRAGTFLQLESTARTRSLTLEDIFAPDPEAGTAKRVKGDLVIRGSQFSYKSGVVAPLWLRAKSAYGGGRGMFEHEVSQALPVQAREAEEVPRSQLGGIQRRAAPPGRFDSLV